MSQTGLQNLPDLGRDVLVEFAGWTVFRDARQLQRAGAVMDWSWSHPALSGVVMDGDRRHAVSVGLKSTTFPVVRCDCPTGRRGQFCRHAVALCLVADDASKAPPTPQSQPAALESTGKPVNRLQSLRHADNADSDLGLRLMLPPNWKEAAQRNAVMIKVEMVVDRETRAPEKLFRGREYRIDENLFQSLALLESWGGGEFASLIQLKAVQLAQLISATSTTPGVWYSVREPGKPIPNEDLLKAVAGPTSGAQSPASPEPDSIPRDKDARPTRTRRISAVEAYRRRMRERPETVRPDRMEVDGSPHFLAIKLPPREHPLYQRALELLRAQGFRSEPSNGRWWLRDQHKVLNFLARHRNELVETYDVTFSDNYIHRMQSVQELDIQCQANASGSGFTLQVSMGDEKVDPSELRRALASGKFYLVGEDRILLVHPDKLERLSQSVRALTGNPDAVWTPEFQTKVGAAQLADAEQLLEDLDEEVVLPDAWKERSNALRQVDRLKAPPLPPDFDRRLRPYQKTGIAWLWHLYQSDLGGVLADEMGLGKTIQAIGLILCAVRDESTRDRGPALVVAPASLTGNWARELSRFAPQLRTFVHHRESRLQAPEAAAGFDVVITSYATLRMDREFFAPVEYSLIIADEAQHIKNRRSQSARTLRSQNGRGRFVLTGTPIENSIDDLRSLFAFCLPGYLARAGGNLRGEDKDWLERRHQQQAAPYILRRDKKLVAPDLPEKIEQVIYCDLDPPQMEFYRKVQETCQRKLIDLQASGSPESRLRFAALTELLRLRQVCADPGMLNPDYPVERSAKLQAFAEILAEARDGGHRVLVFSQFVQLLKRLRVWLEEQGIAHLYLDGSTGNRLELCDRFNHDSHYSAFLISLKAGGTGLNLTGANIVVHFDPWWNPAVEDQATDRAHRIGQDKVVTSYKLIASGTVEEKVRALQERKAHLLRDLLDDSIAHTAKVGIDEIRELLS